MEKKLKHLEFIQGVIHRMAKCSFLLKGWTVILVSGLFALAAKNSNIYYVFLAYMPAFIFWILDGYYLYQEKLYKNLFADVSRKSEDEIDFNMNTRSYEGINKASWLNATFSKTILLFHGILILTIIIVMILILLTKGAENAQASVLQLSL
jgi:hypothetical protein